VKIAVTVAAIECTRTGETELRPAPAHAMAYARRRVAFTR
jgi:hypothetical protein